MAKILIVDDSIIMRRNLKVILTQAGHTVVSEASNGKEAFIEYERHQPDLVTMDITMPIMNGIDSVKKIIACYPEASIIVISALDQRNMVFEALENGAMHYIIKPITAEKVLTVVDAVLKDRNLEQERVDGDSANEGKSDQNGTYNNDDGTSGLPPFAIENKNGTFIININPSINAESFTSLNTAIQGFLFIKPLRIVFNLCSLQSLDETLGVMLAETIGKLKAAKGMVKICSTDKNLAKQLQISYEGIEIIEALS